MFLLFGLEFSIWFLIIGSILLIAHIVTVELEQYIFSGVLLVSFCIIAFFAQENLRPIFRSIVENPIVLPVSFGCYLVIGFVWSFVKWISFLYRFKEYRDELIETFKQEKIKTAEKEDSIRKGFASDIALGRADNSKDELIFFLRKNSYKKTNDLSKPPSFREYKSNIVAWVILWVPSLIGTLLNDFVRKLVAWIANRMSAFYQKLSQKIVGDYLPKDLK